MNSLTTTICFPPGSEWLKEFTSMKEKTQVTNIRGAMGEFFGAVMEGASSFGEMSYKVCGLAYEQGFRLARTLNQCLRANGFTVNFQILDKNEGAPKNAFRLKVGNNVLKIEEESDTFDMLKEVQEGL